MMYEDLIKALRDCANDSCEHCAYLKQGENCFVKFCGILQDAADAIEELKNNVEQYKLYLQDAIKDLQSAHKELPRWIPVTERLPEKDTRVIVCASLPEGVHSDFIYEDGHWFVSIGVTHWMPFPEPPKEE